jgi:uronate dehydrogenase
MIAESPAPHIEFSMPRLLLTGAAGRLGPHLRRRLIEAGHDVLATDLLQPADGASVVIADLADLAAMERLLASGIDAVVHLGGIASEVPWQRILDANIVGTYNVFEAARRNGVGRVIFASTYHVLGMEPVAAAPLDLTAPPRPDSLYAVSKLFGENLARLYADKFGVESLSIRIGAANGIHTERELHVWLHPDDLADLVLAGLAATDLGARIVFGLSGSASPWLLNQGDDPLGWRPQRSSAGLQPPNGASWPEPDASSRWIGAGFVGRGHPDG